jgi:glycine dehydrogenase subunit 2
MASLEELIFDLSSPGRSGVGVPEADVPEVSLTEIFGLNNLRAELDLPEVGQPTAIRHFVRLSQLNHCVDTGFYPLGSCTMKHNPKVNDVAAGLPGFSRNHPLFPTKHCQGSLRVMWESEQILKAVSGFPHVTLQPAAGAQGEFCGILLTRAYHRDHGEEGRNVILVPDSAHGTNPATAARCGCEIRHVGTDSRGNVDIEALKAAVDERVCALMLTNPNTLGLFEERVTEVCDIVHSHGGLVYMDGANMNANLGIVRPAEMGFDVMHFNLHKTFSQPHGGGGPGAGPVACSDTLEPYLPVPRVVRTGDTFDLRWDFPKSIGKLHGWYGNFLVNVRFLAYCLAHGPEGLRQISYDAVLNANYLKALIGGRYHVKYDRICKHEFVIDASEQKRRGASAKNIAKRLLDFGHHPPTVYFPLIVHEALMVEPTESETKEALEAFAQALLQIDREIDENLELVTRAPHNTPIGMLDEAKGSRNLCVTYNDLRRSKPTLGESGQKKEPAMVG